MMDSAKGCLCGCLFGLVLWVVIILLLSWTAVESINEVLREVVK